MCSSVYFNMSQCSSEYESCNWGGGGGWRGGLVFFGFFFFHVLGFSARSLIFTTTFMI